jgi:predicted nucleic acid-binding protein
VATYTADAVALLAYLVDALPQRADRVFAEAEAGEAVVQTPTTAVAETLYSVSRDKDVRGITLQGTPEQARQALLDTGPVTVSADDDELVEFATVVDEFSIHDAMVVASHRAAETEGIVTSDGVIGDAGYETVWK